MTVWQIAAEIDALIERYSRVRQILATLVEDSVDPSINAPKPQESARSEPLRSSAVREEVVVTMLPPYVPRRRQRSAPVRRSEPTALSGLVPQEVVVISAAQILQRIAGQNKTSSAAAEPVSGSAHTLDDLVNALRRRGMDDPQLH